MKIAIVYFGNYLSDKEGAASRRVRDIGRGLSAHGHEVYVCVQRRSTDDQDVIVDGLRVCFLGRPGGSKLRGRIAYWSQLLRLGLEQKLDWVILYNVLVDGYFPAGRLKKKGIKIAAEFCDMHSANYSWKGIRRFGLWLSIKLGEEFNPKVSDLNICISSALIRHCKERAPGTPRMLLPVLVDPETFKISDDAARKAAETWGIRRNDIVITCVGSLGKIQGVAALLEAFANIACKYPGARLIVAGRPMKALTHDDVEGLVAQHGIRGQVIVPGWVKTDDLVAIYSRSDILVIPMLDVEAIQAALPTKLAEYAQMGKAIVSTNVSDIGLYFKNGESALLVKAGQTDAMASALARLIEDQTLRVYLGENAKEVAAEHFNYRQASKRLSDELKRLHLSQE